MGKDIRPIDLQRRQLAEIERNPEKALKEPSDDAASASEKKKKEKVAAPDLFRDLQQSLSGFGSADFHIRKHARRAEYEQQKQYAEEDRQAAEAAEFARKRKELEEKDSAKTAKNRERRKKRKGNGKLQAKGAEMVRQDSEEPATASVPAASATTPIEPDTTDVSKASTVQRDALVQPVGQDQPNDGVARDSRATRGSTLVIVDDDFI